MKCTVVNHKLGKRYIVAYDVTGVPAMARNRSRIVQRAGTPRNVVRQEKNILNPRNLNTIKQVDFLSTELVRDDFFAPRRRIFGFGPLTRVFFATVVIGYLSPDLVSLLIYFHNTYNVRNEYSNSHGF